MPPVEQDLVTAALRAAFDACTPFTVVVDDVPLDLAPPYAVVGPVWPSSMSGPPLSAEASNDCAFTVQVTFFGGLNSRPSRQQAEWAAARARTGFLAQSADGAFVTPIAIDGAVVWWREWQSADGPRVEGTVAVVADRYVIFTSKS